MNHATLIRSGLALRVIPPRASSGLFPLSPNYAADLSAIQRLRGNRYVADGAIPASALDSQGRHVTVEDEQCHHLTIWNGELQGCLRLRFKSDGADDFTDLRVYDLVRRMPTDRARKYHAAMSELVSQYREIGHGIGETGGWAISSNYEHHIAMFALPLAGWSLSRILSRRIFFAAATDRNGSADMLRRLGAWRLKLDGEDLSPFYDPAYGCTMDLLCFDSDILNPKFEPAVHDLQFLLQRQRLAEPTQCLNGCVCTAERN